LENASDTILLADEHGILMDANKRTEMLLGYTREELVGRHFTTLHPISEHERTVEAFKSIVTRGHGVLHGGQIVCKNGDILYTDITGSLIEYGGKKCLQGSFRDVTEKVHLHKVLEQTVQERTAELREINIQLEKEIKEHMHSETLLKESVKKLARNAAKLEEFNAALKILLKEREDDKADLEEKILMNIKHHMSPHLEKLEKRIHNDDRALLKLVQSGVKNITSSFSQKLYSKALHLTPSEIRVADMIRDGKTTKEIAECIGVSTNAVNHHRYHLRKALGIASRKTSLRSYLSTIK
jgi:PAS domain S-box-containing protein